MTPQELQTLRKMNSLYNEIEAVYHEAAVKLGLTDSSSKILYAIADHGDSLPLHHVSLTTGLAKQTINSALRNMERDGILTLDHIDGKAKMARLTPAGKALAEQTVRKLMEMENDIYNSWTQYEIDAHIALSERFLKLFREKLLLLTPPSAPTAP